MEPPESLEPSGAHGPELPRPLAEAVNTPALARRDWQWATAPSYIALFLWVVFFDRLACRTLAIGGLGWSFLGAAVAAVLCYLLLYLAPALWGQSTGRTAVVLGSSTFGARGTLVLLFGVFGAAQAVWMAVGTLYALDWTLQGLSRCGLFDMKTLTALPVRPPGSGRVLFEIRGPLYLVTSLAWIYATALVGYKLVRIIRALMTIYPVFPALMVGIATILTIRGVRAYQPPAMDEAVSPLSGGGPLALLNMIELVFGFFATAGVIAADWGAVSRTPRDVKAGGFVGVAFAAWTVATLAFLTIAGALGQYPVPPELAGPAQSESYTYRVALLLGVPERLAGPMFLFHGLASLAPTCYAAFLLGQRFHALAPAVSRLRWTMLGTTAAWLLVATGLAARLEAVFTIMGAVFAPMAGAMAADYVRQRGGWAGPRRGMNPAGMMAWAAGLLVGLVPLLAPALRATAFTRFQPAALYAFVLAFLVYLGLARIGLEPEALPVPELVEYSEPVAEQEVVAIPEASAQPPAA